MTQTQRAKSGWLDQDLQELLSTAAAALAPITATEAGTSSMSVRFTQTSHAQPIPLGAGIPDPSTLPAADLQQSLERVLARMPATALRYGGVLGCEPLREALAERQSRIEGLSLGAGHFMVTIGSAGGIDAICRTFLNPGDVVLVERPVFAGSLRTFRGHLAEIESVPLEDGDHLANRVAETAGRLSREGRRAKLLYIGPDFHNPTGLVLSRAAREALVDVCAEHRILIIEDAAYTELYFDGAPPASVYALAEGDGVVRAGSFSKILATGLRVGWVQADPQVISAMSKTCFDMGGSPLIHYALADYVGSGRLEAHVDELRALYAAKSRVLSDSLEEQCAPYLRFNRPQGGFFLWADCLGTSSDRVAAAASEEGLVLALGSSFFSERAEDSTHLRLAFSYATPEQLAESGPRLRSVFEQLAD